LAKIYVPPSTESSTSRCSDLEPSSALRGPIGGGQPRYPDSSELHLAGRSKTLGGWSCRTPARR